MGPGGHCQYLIATTVDSSDGGRGQGFSWAVQAGAQAIQAMVDADCRPVAEGGPVAPAAAWDRLWWHLREAGGGIATLAMAAIDIGLWDLQARTAGLGLADLIGRRRDQVPVYASGVNRHLTLDELTEQVSRWVAAGHSRVKIKVGQPSLDEDLERVAAVRRIIGPRCCSWSTRTNSGTCPPPAGPPGHCRHSTSSGWRSRCRRGLPGLRGVAGRHRHSGGGRREPVHRSAIPGLALAGAVDYLQPNVCRVGGITPFLRIARLARLFGVPVMPHLLPDISGQLALCLPLPGMIEDIDEGSFAALGALARPSGVVVSGDSLQAQTEPGHGLVFATDALEQVTP